jgi:hypothetical protein
MTSIVAKFRSSLLIGKRIGVPNTPMYQQDMNLVTYEWSVPIVGDLFKGHLKTTVRQEVRLLDPPATTCRHYSTHFLSRYRSRYATLTGFSVFNDHSLSERIAAIREVMWPLASILSGTAHANSGSLTSIFPVQLYRAGIFLRSVRWNDPGPIRCDLGVSAFLRSLSHYPIDEVSLFQCAPLESSNRRISGYDSNPKNFQYYGRTVSTIEPEPPVPEAVKERTHRQLIRAAAIVVIVIGILLLFVGFCGLVAAIASGWSLFAFIAGFGIVSLGFGLLLNTLAA